MTAEKISPAGIVLVIAVNRTLCQIQAEITFTRSHFECVYPRYVMTAPDMRIAVANHALFRTGITIVKRHFNSKIVAVYRYDGICGIFQRVIFNKIFNVITVCFSDFYAFFPLIGISIFSSNQLSVWLAIAEPPYFSTVFNILFMP